MQPYDAVADAFAARTVVPAQTKPRTCLKREYENL